MPIYKNIDGTTKPSFKIGARGITIVPKAVISGTDTLMRIAIKDNKNQERFLLFEDEVDIPTTLCTDIKQEGKITTFTIRNPDGTKSTIVVNTQTGGLTGPNGAVENNLASFSDSSGQNLKDSGVGVENEIHFNTNGTLSDESLNKVPTTEAVVDYIGDISTILALRLRGADYTKYKN